MPFLPAWRLSDWFSLAASKPAVLRKPPSPPRIPALPPGTQMPRWVLRHLGSSRRIDFVIHVDVNDPAVMNLALNNVSNVVQHYGDLSQKVEVEVVAYGPGLHMLRDDTSPVKGRIKMMTETTPELTFSACGNTRENMTKNEGKEVPLITQAKVTKSGVVRLMELQEQGWSYLRP
ncbi:intracellular sulfur oxidation DsrE/DsrF family protein [Bradyrhizobium sp. i1.3.6]